MSRTPGEVELRVELPRHLMDMLDARVMARRSSRKEETIAIFEQWAKELVHQSTLVQRLARGNPLLMGREAE